MNWFISRLLWHSGAKIIWFASVLHIAWAGMICVSDAAAMTTPVAGLTWVLGRGWALITVLSLVATLAVAGMALFRTKVGLLMMLPQQTVLVMSAIGALTAISQGMYADGVARPVLFILADQMPTLLLAPSYTVGVLAFHNVWRGPQDVI